MMKFFLVGHEGSGKHSSILYSGAVFPQLTVPPTSRVPLSLWIKLKIRAHEASETDSFPFGNPFDAHVEPPCPEDLLAKSHWR